ncbi:MAG: AAA family ATPase [Cyanobacteria bacterium P01_G01_bin.54]
MLTLQDYTVTELINTGLNNLVYRGYRNGDRTPVVIKTPLTAYPTLKDLAKLKHEYELVRTLDCQGVVKPLIIQKYQQSQVLILEDFGGQSLELFLNQAALTLDRFLPIAIALADILGQVHQKKVIHKDIKPSNIIINPESGLVKLTDFGISSQLSSETTTDTHHNALEGTLAYISPEQTGRMNRSIDYRTDLYSLGVTFYQMLTGTLPFEHQDTLELIHAHLAKTPLEPRQVNTEIPLPVSKIVLKLLEKNAENRYQTAFFLKQDLETCLQQWQRQGRIPDFAIAAQNVSEQFQIPQKLYGRDAEVHELLNAFEFAAGGNAEFILISGYSGIGKSSLVHEVHKPIVRQKGFFVSGKFDQFQRDIPYASLIQALQELIRQLLTETTAIINQWQDRLQTALGSNGQVLVDVIPELELIVGEQPPVPHLGPAETQTRFNSVFQKFIQVFTQAEHPLVLFLDDLQWADSASLKFIQLLMTNLESHHLLVIGAYRDNEVSPSHPLMLTLDTIRGAGALVKDITIGSLALGTTNRLIADTLHRDLAQTESLAALCHQKTNGNPFFLNQLLKSLHSDRLVYFDLAQGCWQWDLVQIQAAEITENVVDLMIAKLTKLPPHTQDNLKLAACIGNRFSLNVLATVREQPISTTAQDLWDALQAGFVLPLSDAYKIPLLWEQDATMDTEEVSVDYRFLHDRVQQAAYALIPESEKQTTHLKIGQLLLANTPEIELLDKVFDIVNHFNAGFSLISDTQQLECLARLSLQAGKKAKDSTAYEPAAKYFLQGIECLDEAAWQTQYDLMFALYRERSECEYLCGNFETAEALFDETLAHCRSNLDRAAIQNIRIVLYDNTGKYLEGLAAGSAVLQDFDLQIPTTDNDQIIATFDQELEHYKASLKILEISKLIEAPTIQSAETIACLEILMNMTGLAYFTNQDLLALISLKMTNICITQGNCDIAAHGYAFWGMISGVRLLDYERSYAFGELAMAVNQRYPNPNLTCKVHNNFGALISPWRRPLKESIPILREGYRVGIETGDVYASYNSYNLILQRILQSESPERIIEESNRHLDFLRKTKNHVFVGVQQMDQHFLLSLQGKTLDRLSLSDEGFKEEDCVQMWQDNLFLPGVATYNIFKTQILYLYGEYESALQMAHRSAETVVFVSSIPNQAEHNFYYSLTLAALCPTATPEQRQDYLAQIAQNQKMMQLWAENCPENFEHKDLLVQAEIARIQGEFQQALSLYDAAIASAQTNEFINGEALANELAGKFWLAQGHTKFARLYLVEAYYGYQRWQASAKAEQLRTTYPDLIAQIQKSPAPLTERSTLTTLTTASHSSTSTTTGASLDWVTMLKAAEALSRELKLEQLLLKLMQILLENVGATQGYLLLPRFSETAGQEFYIEAEGAVNQQAALTVLEDRNLSERLPNSVLNYVVRIKKAVVLSNASADETFGQDPYIQAQQPKSLLCSPLLNQGQVMGVVYLENALTAEAFTRDRLEVVQVLSGQAAISLENARFYQTLENKVAQRTQQLAAANAEITQLNQRLKAENVRMGAELDVARRVQEMIIPRQAELRQVVGLDIAGLMMPADEIGGDYYDVLVEDDVTTLAIGDVTGHGLESGLLMMMAQTTVRTLKELREMDPVRFLNTVNATLYKNAQRMGVERNMTLSILNYAQGRLSISGQHEELLLLRANGRLEQIDTLDLGMTIGLIDDIAEFIAQTTVELQSGDGIVLYTDGIPEAKNAAGEYYGLARLGAVIQQNWFRDAQGVQAQAIADLNRFIGDRKVADDITLLVLKQR